ncbi:MAG: TetR/AcrR family transcriptional regulator [Acidobacteriota bacterium]
MVKLNHEEDGVAADWRQRQKQQLRRQLYETAVELFERDGYDSTTVQQITERVGVAKGTFFNHFPTKEHVVEEWYSGLTVACLKRARKRRGSTAEDAVCRLVVEMAGKAASTPELMAAKAQHSSHPLLVTAEQAQSDELADFVRAQCAAGKERGELDAGLDEEFFAGLLVAVLTGTSRAWVRALPRFDFAGVVEERLRFLFRAARASQG